jgi:hypothetical protein
MSIASTTPVKEEQPSDTPTERETPNLQSAAKPKLVVAQPLESCERRKKIPPVCEMEQIDFVRGGFSDRFR